MTLIEEEIIYQIPIKRLVFKLDFHRIYNSSFSLYICLTQTQIRDWKVSIKNKRMYEYIWRKSRYQPLF